KPQPCPNLIRANQSENPQDQEHQKDEPQHFVTSTEVQVCDMRCCFGGWGCQNNAGAAVEVFSEGKRAGSDVSKGHEVGIPIPTEDLIWKTIQIIVRPRARYNSDNRC